MFNLKQLIIGIIVIYLFLQELPGKLKLELLKMQMSNSLVGDLVISSWTGLFRSRRRRPRF